MAVKQTIIVHELGLQGSLETRAWKHVWATEAEAADYEAEYREVRGWVIDLLEADGGSVEFKTEPTDEPVTEGDTNWPEVALV